MAEITRLLVLASDGDRDAQERLYHEVEPYARAIALRLLRGRTRGPEFQTTVLIHDAFLDLVRNRKRPWADRGQFLGVLGQRVHQRLMDYLRRLGSIGRGGKVAHVSIDEADDTADDRAGDPSDRLHARDRALALGEELEELSRVRPDYAEIIRMKWFLEMSTEEIAAVRGKSVATINRHALAALKVLRAGLRRRGFDDDVTHGFGAPGGSDLPGPG